MAFDPIEDLKTALIGVLNHNVALKEIPKGTVPDFKDQRATYYRNQVRQNLAKILEITQDMDDATKEKVDQLQLAFESGDPKTMLGISGELTLPKQVPSNISTSYQNLNLPFEIRDDVLFDLTEVERCFQAQAYRSVMILCARILETALHRKYYDVTGKDLLETSPNIGLGNIISKLKDANIEIDPAITQQIHLINNVRIFSVHKKQGAFQPSKEQSQATLMYTIDILKKLF